MVWMKMIFDMTFNYQNEWVFIMACVEVKMFSLDYFRGLSGKITLSAKNNTQKVATPIEQFRVVKSVCPLFSG